MYTLAIYIYMLGVRIATLFNPKAKKMMRGHRDTWRILRQQVTTAERYIWVHVSSLGEFEQGRPIIERIKREHKELKIILTFFSPSGYEVQKNYKGADVICYLPFDTPLNTRKFLKLAHPEKAIFIKYEFWQNYLKRLHRHSIPIYSVSSIFRPDQIFFRWYGHGYSKVLKCFTHFFVQNSSSEALLKKLGITCTTVVGDTRFDRVIDTCKEAKELPIVEAFCKQEQSSRILIAGSTWAPDEDILIAYFNAHKELKLVLAPHVVSEEHLQEIESKLQRPSLRYTQANEEKAASADCLIIDCYGLLSSIYRYGEIAYVGGGFGVGIHNVPEAAVYGVPVIIGPNNKHFHEAQMLLHNGGCLEIDSAESFNTTIQGLLDDPDKLKKAGEAAESYIRDNAGVADKVYKAIPL